MRHDVTTFGELVIDLIPLHPHPGRAYVAQPGGAPANVAAGLARLGRRSAMISKVGVEPFGDAALAALAATGVDVAGIVRTSEQKTALAVVTETASGEADYFFYRENCADSNLAAHEVASGLIAASSILHVGTLPLASPLSAAAQRHAIRLAQAAGALVSTDPNFRMSFWRDLDSMRAAGMEVIRAANIVKVSEAELALLTGISGIRDAVRSLWRPGLIALAVTRGAAGADLFTQDQAISVPAFTVAPVDTVGCGDAFMASLLAGLLESRLEAPSAEALHGIALRCCAAGAIIATRSGALGSMPTKDDIDGFLAENGRPAPR